MATSPARTRWTLAEADPDRVRRLAGEHSLPELVARMLVLRGVPDEEVGAHLERSPRGLHDPDLMPGMGAACERLSRAIDAGETILIHGDYDVDGVTGTALLMRCLRLLGADVHWHIPNRLVDGYSFGEHSIERARATGATLGISVDNGTSAFETIAALADAGVDTIVTDHHEPPLPHPKYGALPPATAIVNPKLPDSSYPWRELCGGAVAFKLAWGIAKHRAGGERVSPAMRDFLTEAMSYVAIATIADVVPMRDENRVLAWCGLKALRAATHPGLRALCEVAGIDGRPLTPEDVGFQIGPRINASGRLGSAERAVELLLAEDAGTARRLAGELDTLNRRRKEIEQAVMAEARAEAQRLVERDDPPVLVLAGQGWHQGVVGIVAARLTESFARPAIVIGLDGDSGRGSARSVRGFDVLSAMRGADGLYEGYGGHAQAAGCEVRADAVDAIREAVCARALELDEEGARTAELRIDAEVPLESMTPETMRQLDRLEPWGSGHAPPTFLSRDLRLAQPPRVVGSEGQHLMLRVRRGPHVLKAMAFRMASRAGELALGAPLDLVHRPKWNTFRGETTLELQALDFRAGGQ